jgi:hypothetical protein
LDGHKIWSQVANTIDDRAKNKHCAAHQENVTAAS